MTTMIDEYPPPFQHCRRHHRIGIILIDHLIHRREPVALPMGVGAAGLE